MSDFVESLLRLYLDRRLKEATLNALWHKGKISRNEFDYIVGGKETSNVHDPD